MKQGDSLKNIAITLQNFGGEMVYLTLSMGGQHDAKLHLSLHEARNLASNLIQHVHQAEVRNSLKRAALKTG